MLRLSGLASGMDTESMIKELMKAEKLKVDKVEREKVGLEWKKEVWQGFNTKLMSFYNKELFNSKLTSTFKNKGATSSSNIVNPSASSTAPVGTHKFKVNQMAKGVSLMSKKLETTTGDPIEFDTKISELQPGFSGVFQFKVDGAASEMIVGPNTTIYELLDNINSADGISATLDKDNGRLFVSTSNTGEDAKLSISSSTGDTNVLFNDILGFLDDSSLESVSTKSLGDATTLTSTLDGVFGITTGSSNNISLTIGTVTKNITVGGSETIQDLVNKINTEFGADTVSFDDETKGLKFADTAAKPIAFSVVGTTPTADESALVSGLGIGFNFQGVNAKIEYQDQEMEFNSNSINVNGIGLELQGQSTEEIFVTVTHDANKTVDNIKDFVKAYNEVLAEGNKLLYAKPVKGYNPLTKEEADSLDDDTKKTWIETVKSDMLRGDVKLSSIVRRYRSLVSSTGTYDKLSEMGITTGLYTERGKLIIDEDKLMKAVKKDPDMVQEVFNDLAKDMHEFTKDSVASTKLSSAMTLYNDKQMETDIKTYTKKMDDLQDRLTDIENRYYKQFSAMEAMLAKLNSQSSSFASMVGGV